MRRALESLTGSRRASSSCSIDAIVRSGNSRAAAHTTFKAFEKEYTTTINACNQCHEGMGYGFIKVVKQRAPSDVGVDYKVSSKAEDVPK